MQPILNMTNNSFCLFLHRFRLFCLRIQFCVYTSTSAYVDAVIKFRISNNASAKFKTTLGSDHRYHVDTTTIHHILANLLSKVDSQGFTSFCSSHINFIDKTRLLKIAELTFHWYVSFPYKNFSSIMQLEGKMKGKLGFLNNSSKTKHIISNRYDTF